MSLNDTSLEHLRPALTDGARQLQIPLTEDQQDRLLQYLALFKKWNAAYNLTAVRNPGAMLVKHLLDSLSVVPYFARNESVGPVLDVGTGGGLPGIPLAVALPHYTFTLLDGNGKKMRFLHQVQQSLKLGNVQLAQHRVELHQSESGYRVIISRAFASLPDMLRQTEHLLAPGGYFFAMKGHLPEDELSPLTKHYMVSHYPLTIPGLDEERCLVILSPVAE